MKLGRWFGAFLCLAAIVSAQTTPVQVTAKLIDGSGNVYRQGFLHFELQNCGSNFPLVPAGGGTVAKSSFDLKPNQVNGSLIGQAIGYDQIFCGGIASTQYDITVMKDANTPVSPSKHYLLCSSSAPLNSQCSNQIAGIFDLATAQPMDQPVQPGHVQLFGNPTKDQIWNQPSGTKAVFIGTFDFTLANLIGISGGGGGGGISSVTGTAPIMVSAGSAPVISIAKADSSHDGYLSASDWGLFNAKQSGTVTSVGITVPQGLAISGCPITGAGTCAISLNGQFPVSSLGTGSATSLTWLNGSGAWTSPLTFGGLPVTSLVQGTNTALSLSSNALTVSSTSAVTYPILAPDGVPPQHSFANHPELGLNTVLSGSKIQITQVVVAGTFPTQTITLTLSTPVQGHTLTWLAGDTFQLTALPASPTNLTSLNGVRYTVTTPSGANPFSTLAFTAPNTSIAAGTYAVTAGSASVFDILFQGHGEMFSRLDTSTNVGSQHGSIRFARRDSICARTNSSADDGIDNCLIRGSQQFNAQNAVGAGYLRINGTPAQGASTISLAKGAIGANWLAKDGDVIEVIHPNGDAEKQDYTIVGDTTVTQGTNTTVTITPVLATALNNGDLVVTSRIMAQLGDASGVEILGPVFLANTVRYPDGCLTVATGIVASTGLSCGGSGSAAGANKDIQFTSGSGVFAVDTGVFTYDTATAKLFVGTMSVKGKSTDPNETTYTNGTVVCAAPGAGKSAWCFDTDGFFKVSENNGAFFRPGNGAGSGNVVIQGSPSAGQTAEWSDSTHIAGISGVTGTGGYVKATGPTIVAPKLDVINDVNNKASITIAATTNAVDGLRVTNAATANPAVVTVDAFGPDPNIGINFVSKGTGTIQCNGVACGGGGSTYTNLFQSDANTLTQRNSGVTQAYQLMGTYTDASNNQGLELGANYAKTIHVGTGVAVAYQFGVVTSGIGSAFRGWQVDTSTNLVPFNTSVNPNIGAAANRIGTLFGIFADFTNAVTVTVANDTVTGTTVNKLAKLTTAPSKLIVTSTSDTDDFEGIITSGAGLSGSATVARFGFANCVFDAGTTAGDYVVNSATVSGDCHDSGSSRPASGKVVGRVQTTNVSAGTYQVLLGLDSGGGGGGGSGTVSTISTTGGAPLFSSAVNNPTTTPQIVFTLSNAGANTIYANASGSSAAPSFVTPLLTGSLFSNQGTVSTVLTGNAAGNLSFGKVNLATMLDANSIPINNIAGGVGATASTVLFGDNTWRVPSGGGNVTTSGTITANQTAEWATTTSLRAVGVTGSGLYVKGTAGVLSNPLIASIKDGNGNPGLDFIATPSAVDSLTITNAASGSPVVQIGIQGADLNADLQLNAKGGGVVKINADLQTVSVKTSAWQGTEGTDPTLCLAAKDVFYSSSVAHRWVMCSNGGAQQQVVGSSVDISTNDLIIGLHLPAVRAGDLAYYNGIGWQTIAGNNTGSQFLIENSAGVPSWSAGTAAVAWSALQTPVSNLVLTMGSNQSLFNYSSGLSPVFQWANTTAATSGVSQGTPGVLFAGAYWTGAASASDTWTMQGSVGNGTNGAATFSIGHSGSTGLALVQSPGFKGTSSSAFVGAEVSCASIAAAAAGIDAFCPDQTLHGWKMANNNGTAVPVVGGPASSTSGDVAVFSGTTGALLQDTGITAAQLLTSSTTFTNGELLVASGSSRVAASAGIQSSTVVTAASTIVDSNVVQGAGGVRGVSDTGIATNTLVTASANYTVGHLVSAAANNKTTTDSGLLASDVLSNASNFTLHGVAIGSGSKTLTSTAVGTTGIPLIGQTAADPVFGTAAIAGGGTGATTAPNAAIAILPVATRAGDVLYWDGSSWNHLAGNNSGTNFLQENSSGVPTWAAGSSVIALSAVTAAVGSNTINNGDNAQRWNWAMTTSGQVGMRISENTAATSAGTPWLFQVDSITSSTANIAKFTALGTANGVGVLKTGFLTSLGTGGADSNFLHCDVTDSTKCVQLTLSGITTATTRALTIANGASTTVIADTGSSNNFLTAISASGVISKARPAIADLSDGANVPTAASNFSSKGFVFGNAADKTLASTAQCAANTLPHGNGSSNPTCSAIVAADIANATITGTQIASSLSLTTPILGAATATSLLASGIVDGKAPVTVTTGTSATLGASTYQSGYTFNQEATAGTGVTYTLPATATGLQQCVKNSIVSGTGAADTGVLTVNPAASSYLIKDGTIGVISHGMTSGGAAGDAACMVAVDATHWEVYVQKGIWTLTP